MSSLNPQDPQGIPTETSAIPANIVGTGGLRMVPKAFLFAAPFLLTGIAWGIACWVYFGGWIAQQSPEVAQETTAPPDGARLYALKCANCHGLSGNGQGSILLTTPARHFGYDKFKFATTSNSMPTEQNIEKVIRNGIPGSAMPPFPFLRDDEVQAISQHVLMLTRNGLYQRIYEKAWKEAEETGDEFYPGELRRRAEVMLKLGDVLTIPTNFSTSTPESVQRGLAIFAREGCVKCHGAQGRGDGEQVKDPNFKNEDGTRAFPRDLTLGVYKGGGTKQDLYARIKLGIPGTPMPSASSALKPDEMDDLLNYVLSLKETAPPSTETAAASVGTHLAK